jgi:hypothetical protein
VRSATTHANHANWDPNQPQIGFYGYWYQCNQDEVLVGVHIAQGKVTCAKVSVPPGATPVTIQNPTVNYAQGGTVVPWNNFPVSAYMHGCPPNTWVQGIMKEGANAEDLLCVSFWQGQTQQLNVDSYVDYGTNPTASVAAYGLSPNMHVCEPLNGNQSLGIYAMAGIHSARNDFYCAR